MPTELGQLQATVLLTIKRIPNISKPRIFRIDRIEGEVRVCFKSFRHSSDFTGVTTDGQFVASALPHGVFTGLVPRMRDATPSELKRVPDYPINMIQQRYKASHPRLDSTYPFGESITRIACKTPSHLCFSPFSLYDRFFVSSPIGESSFPHLKPPLIRFVRRFKSTSIRPARKRSLLRRDRRPHIKSRIV